MKKFNTENVSKLLNRKSALIIILLLNTIKIANATPSTIIWIPSADFQGFKIIHLGVDNYIRTEKFNNTRGAGVYVLGLTAGILPFQKFRIEAGADYMSMGDGIYDDHPIYFNAKAGFPENTIFKNSPALVAGGYNFGLKHNLTNYNILYALAAKTLPIIGRLSAGYYWGNEKLLTDSGGNKDNRGLLLSMDRQMKEISDKLWFGIDYQGGKNYLGSLNFGFSWSFSDKISLILGYDIYNDRNVLYNSKDANRNTFTTQLDINF